MPEVALESNIHRVVEEIAGHGNSDTAAIREPLDMQSEASGKAEAKSSPEEEVELKELKDLEKSVEKIANQLGELNKELTGIQQGFLAKDLQAEALCKRDRRVKATIEQFMKILEETDTPILPENFKDSRLKRKGLVKRVQAFLAECDTVGQTICQDTERLQSTNLALAK
ncbi:PREDICTED: BAG family molecular chaperone regulator 1-like [Hipposideros armiger]|uniref:BAG family molecular chaperone regulator 1-like n=1 Tax=Hipposideros armiger TaxID=186990 RepID=A0A8B7SAI0_HIPAR|nr:PREDICTED: BAG family molecular chaperone regulator 1-like [Hipposideros armiger]